MKLTCGKMSEEDELNKLQLVAKFKSLWKCGRNARLAVTTRNGKAWANLNVGLGRLQELYHHPQHLPAQGQDQGGNSRARRLQRIAHERKAAVETAAPNATVAVAEEEVARKDPIKNNEANEKVKDEFCSDKSFEVSDLSKELDDPIQKDVEKVIISPVSRNFKMKSEQTLMLLDSKLLI